MKLKEAIGQKAGDLEVVKNYVSGDLTCSEKFLISLEGCPEKITGKFECIRNSLTSLEGGPKEVSGNYNCGGNRLKTLKGCPEKINSDFSCSNNQLSSFEYFPKYIGTSCYFSKNNFTSFKNIDKYIEYIGGNLVATDMNITSGLSDLFGIDGLTDIWINHFHTEIEDIVNKYIYQKDLINFQDEMIKAGLESYL